MVLVAAVFPAVQGHGRNDGTRRLIGLLPAVAGRRRMRGVHDVSGVRVTRVRKAVSCSNSRSATCLSGANRARGQQWITGRSRSVANRSRWRHAPRSFRRSDPQHGAPCQQRLAREKAGRIGIDRVSEDRIDAPRKLVKVAPGLPSVVIRAFNLSALELHRNATAATTKRRLQEFRPRQVRNEKESTAALIRKSETAMAVCSTRQVLDLCSAYKGYQEGQTIAQKCCSNGQGAPSLSV
jgi:hypothetical protein